MDFSVDNLATSVAVMPWERARNHSMRFEESAKTRSKHSCRAPGTVITSSILPHERARTVQPGLGTEVRLVAGLCDGGQ